MFNPVNSTPPSAKDAIFGVVIAMVACYSVYNLPNFLRGDFSIDLGVIRFLLVIGILVIGFGWWEARQSSRPKG